MKKTIAWFLILILALGLAGCGGISIPGLSGSAEAEAAPAAPAFAPPRELSGVRDEDGGAWLPTMDGGVFRLDSEEITQSVITPDRSRAVYIEDGALYTCRIPDGEPERLDREAVLIYGATDSSVLYVRAGEDGLLDLFRCSYDGEKPLAVRRGVSPDMEDHMVCSSRSLNVAYADDGRLYYLDEHADSPEKIGTYEGVAEFLYVADNGSFVVWMDKVEVSSYNYTSTVMCWEDGERSRLCEFEGSDALVFADLSERYFVFTCNSGGDTYLKEVGGEAVRLRLPRPIDYFPATPRGWFHMVDYDPAEGLYLLDADATLYWFDAEGEREKVVSEIDYPSFDSGSFACSRGFLFYLKDGNLYAGPVAGSELDAEKVMSDVSYIVPPVPDAEVIWFTRGEEDDYAQLYALRVGDTEPVKVAGEVYSELNCIIPGTDGKSVLFYKDFEFPLTGTLYRYAWGDEGPVKISRDVLVEQQEDLMAYAGFASLLPWRMNELGMWMGLICADTSSFLYRKSIDVRENDEVFYNLMYFDGEESTRLAGDVTYYAYVYYLLL